VTGRSSLGESEGQEGSAIQMVEESGVLCCTLLLESSSKSNGTANRSSASTETAKV